MKLREILQDLQVLNMTADPETEIRGISYDSRKTEPGDLFVAIKGFEADGHRFIPKALEKGAAVILCEDAPGDDTPYVQIADCRYGLAIASANFFRHPAKEMKIVGFTGTSGKTSSTQVLKHVLETELHTKVGLIGTNGNMIGQEQLHSERTTPESFELQKLFRRMADAGCTHVVMEVSSHSLTLERVAGITFDVAVFTNLSQDHLDLHGTMEAYAEAKKKIFSQCKAGCINRDDARAAFMAEGESCPLFTYAIEQDEADLVAEDISLTAGGVSFTAVNGEERSPAKLAIPGMFSVYNALSVIAAGLCLGLSLEQCTDGLASASGVKGRMESVPTDGDYHILIDYSHKPDALEKALKTLRPLTRGRLIVLFGCGGDRDHGKRPIMGRIALDLADCIVVTSDNPRSEDPDQIIRDIEAGLTDAPEAKEIHTIPDRREAIEFAVSHAAPDDVIMIAGKGHENYQILKDRTIHFDDGEVVRDYFRKGKADA